MRYSIGAEIDNDPRSRPDAQNIVDAMRPDGMIRSVHFLPIAHPQHGENWMWPFDNAEFKEFYDVVGTERVWELYVATLLDAIEKLPGHIVGHFYVPAKFGHWPEPAKLEAYEDRLVDACAERGMAIEINSRYLYKYYAGDDDQTERFRAAHLRLTGESEGQGRHDRRRLRRAQPQDQGAAFDAVLALLDEADINEIAFPINGRLARVALRATEEILRQHSAALAVPQPLERRSAEAGDSDDDEAEESAPAAVAAVAATPPGRRTATENEGEGEGAERGTRRHAGGAAGFDCCRSPKRPRPRKRPTARRHPIRLQPSPQRSARQGRLPRTNRTHKASR